MRFRQMITLFLFVCFAHPAFCIEGWVDYSSEHHITAMSSCENIVWCATQTSVFSFDINTKEETRYREADGLINDTVNDITIDRFGTVWCATDAGVSSFDGDTWTSYASSDYFDGKKVTTIEIDRDSVIWFGTDKGVVCFDGEVWQTHQTETPIEVVSSTIDSANVKWFGTKEQGLIRYYENKWEQFTSINTEGDADSYNFTATPVEVIGFNQKNQFIVTVYSKLSVITYDGNIWTYNDQDRQTPTYSTAIETNTNGTIAIGSSRSGLFLCTDEGQSSKVTRINPPQNILSLKYDSDNTLWIGTNEGLVRLTDTLNQELVSSTYPPEGYVHDIEILEDEIWFACDNDIKYYKSTSDNFKLHYRYSSDIINLEVTPEHAVYFIDPAKIVYQLSNGKKEIIYSEEPDRCGPSTDIVLDQDNSLWVGVEAKSHRYGGLYHFPADKFLRNYSFFSLIILDTEVIGASNSRYSFIDKATYDIEGTDVTIEGDYTDYLFRDTVIDQNNVLWSMTGVTEGSKVKSFNHGIVRTEYATGFHLTTDNSPLPSNTIQCLAVDKANAKWFGTDKGFARFDDENWEVFTTENSGLIDDDVTAIAFTADNTAWIGTASGVCVYTGDQVVSVEDDYGAEVTPEARPLVSVHPNPFNPTTTIRYELAKPAQVKLAVYSIAGQKVATLVDAPMTAGRHEAVFDGAGLASGVYVYRLDADGAVTSGKMLMVR